MQSLADQSLVHSKSTVIVLIIFVHGQVSGLWTGPYQVPCYVCAVTRYAWSLDTYIDTCTNSLLVLGGTLIILLVVEVRIRSAWWCKCCQS